MLKKLNELKKDKVLLVSVIALIAYVLSFSILRFLKFNYDYEFGYLDHQLYWEALHRLLDGQIIYRDFYWEYGPLYLIYSLPFFVLLGKTFRAYVFIRMVVLPLTGFVLSYFVGRKLLKDKFLVLFLFASVLYSTLDFTTVRHIVAELGLIVVIFGLKSGARKKILFGSFLMGLSFLAGIEYALIGVVALTIYILLAFIFSHKRLSFKNILYAYSGILVMVLLFFGYLAVYGALNNYVNFFKEFSTSFLIQSPCRSQYPILFDVRNAARLGFGPLLNQLRRWNLYFVPVAMALTLYYLIKNFNKIKHSNEVIALLLFAGASYVRVMINPCIGIMAYGMMFFVLALVYLLQVSKSKFIKIALAVTLIFLSVWASNSGPFDYIGIIKLRLGYKKDQEYLNQEKIYLSSDKVENINQVKSYIMKNTKKGEYVYVYPYGPYNILTGTKSPVDVIISTHFELAPFLVPKTIENLEEHKPEIIVINDTNAWSYLASLHQIPRQVIDVNGTPVFMSALTDVEKYISQNYKVQEKLEGAIILKRRDAKVDYVPAYIKKDVEIQSRNLSSFSVSEQNEDSVKLEVTGRLPEAAYIVDSMEDVNLVKIGVKGNKGIFKYSALYLINAYIINPTGNILNFRTDVLSTDWENMWIYFQNNGSLNEGGIVLFTIYDNRGFFDIGGYPRNIEVKDPEFYQINPAVIGAISEDNQ